MSDDFKQLAITRLQSASVELSIAATCLKVNNTQQLQQYLNMAKTNLRDAEKILSGSGVDDAQWLNEGGGVDDFVPR